MPYHAVVTSELLLLSYYIVLNKFFFLYGSIMLCRTVKDSHKKRERESERQKQKIKFLKIFFSTYYIFSQRKYYEFY